MEGVVGRAIPAAQGASTLLEIDEQTQIGAARRSAVTLAHGQGLDDEAIGRVAIVVTEAASNIVRHAGRGMVVLRAFGDGPAATVEVLALDKGPGMPDVARAMRNGYSTSGTAGQGLGGIKRLSNLFDIYSEQGHGTALLARVGAAPRSTKNEPVLTLEDSFGVVSVPLRGETECGDAWRVIEGRERISVLLVDGLGHGHHAAEAAELATAAFPGLAQEPPENILTALDSAMRGSRGAALSVAVIDTAAGTASFTGVGNVEGRVLLGEKTEHLVAQSGIVGHTMPTVRSSTASWGAGAFLVMHSDGVSARWRLDGYPRLGTVHPALLAGIIYRDFARGRDDATVLVLGASPESGGAEAAA